MKKQLLYAFAFVGAMTSASAQQTITHLSSESDNQRFTVGRQSGDDINDIDATVTATGSGILVDNNSFFGIRSDATDDNDATGTFTFIVTTDSATDINAAITIDTGKRAGSSVTGTINVTAGGTYPETAFTLASDGVSTSTTEGREIGFGSVVTLNSAAPLTFVVALTSLANDTNTVNPIFRLENVDVEKDGVLLSDAVVDFDADATTSSIEIVNNPVANSIELSNPKEAKIQDVSVYSISGQLVKSFSQGEYNVSDLATGVYSVRIKTESGSKSIKIIKE